ncbi:MAG: tRNA (guanosine(37)-N1)-methyltransferase TrmD [Candidatus Gastranaerophilales bacterium]|nr:tRNA (guanosine(37)-N1)-methyltransferase TrmD [Candidatus Gastranaerophilales bacterium]
MKFHILTLFPEMVLGGLHTSVIGKAAARQAIEIHAINIRDFTQDKHGSVDDYPYGGGAGMLMQAQPVFDAYRAVVGEKTLRTIYLTPQGVPFTQKLARELSKESELVFLCGHYEGIDERVLDEIVTDRVSIGDYVLTGGELPAMVMVDAIARLIPGVLGNEASPQKETFHNDLLEYPQYSRPREWHGKEVPKVLLSGDHNQVEAWRLEQARERTQKLRPDLYAKFALKEQLIKSLSRDKRNNIHLMETLSRGTGEILFEEDGSLLLYHTQSGVCLLHVARESAGERLLSHFPASCKRVLASPSFGKALLSERLGFQIYRECYQVCYTKREPLPVRYRNIRTLTQEDAGYVLAQIAAREADYMPEQAAARESVLMPEKAAAREAEFMSACGEKELADYVSERILANALYGAWEDERLIGFAGVHVSGAVGMLYVEEAYRGRGIGGALAAYVINREREAGHIPYVQIAQGNEETLRLTERLGLYPAKGRVCWLFRK